MEVDGIKYSLRIPQLSCEHLHRLWTCTNFQFPAGTITPYFTASQPALQYSKQAWQSSTRIKLQQSKWACYRLSTGICSSQNRLNNPLQTFKLFAGNQNVSGDHLESFNRFVGSQNCLSKQLELSVGVGKTGLSNKPSTGFSAVSCQTQAYNCDGQKVHHIRHGQNGLAEPLQSFNRQFGSQNWPALQWSTLALWLWKQPCWSFNRLYVTFIGI